MLMIMICKSTLKEDGRVGIRCNNSPPLIHFHYYYSLGIDGDVADLIMNCLQCSTKYKVGKRDSDKEAFRRNDRTERQRDSHHKFRKQMRVGEEC